MKTVTELIEWYNKRKSETYHVVEVADPMRGPYASLTYFDVSEVTKTTRMISFYGRNEPNDPIRYVRINNGTIIKSEA